MNLETLLKREKLLKNICTRLTNFVDLKNTLRTILSEVKEVSGFEAVSIRLKDEGDYPFYVFDGFSNQFIQTENFLCTGLGTSETGKKPVCLCGNVIQGRTDSSKSYYTPKGSYWTNCSSETLHDLLKFEKQAGIRNFCNKSGYESIGLFPIKTREDNIGLIQLNDRRKDLFTADVIEFMEMIGEQVGVAIENATLYEKLKQKNTELQQKFDELNHIHSHMLEARKMTALADLVTGVSHEIYQPVSESVLKLENLRSLTRKTLNELPGSSDRLKEIIEHENDIFHELSKVKTMVKSFRSIAFDQYQESRHLINVKEFLQEIITVIRPSLKQKSIEFSIDCNEHAEILCFSGVLSQILAMLIRNAAEHGLKDKPAGIIKLRCVLTNDDFVELRVSDNGPGISPSIKEVIFEPFYTTDGKNHLGLGLYTARNLAETKLKGTLNFEQKAGSTDFIIHLPF